MTMRGKTLITYKLSVHQRMLSLINKSGQTILTLPRMQTPLSSYVGVINKEKNNILLQSGNSIDCFLGLIICIIARRTFFLGPLSFLSHIYIYIYISCTLLEGPEYTKHIFQPYT